jgi:putative flavoprotein involved in K+ transport
VVLERGEVANSWRTERWDSLRLLTPNWQSRLPGLGASSEDPDAFRSMPELVDLLGRYALTIAAPVLPRTKVTSIARTESGYRVLTERGSWHARTVVLAPGACNLPCVPGLAAALPPGIATLTPALYRNPDQLAAGGVLVVGASATGVQLAHEIHLSGRPVTLAVGDHVRVPRDYRGRDIQWWLDRTGVLAQRRDEVEDLDRARRLPSFQLVGSPERRTADLNALSAIGVRLVGRIVGIDRQKLQFSGSLANQCALADLKLGRLLDDIDLWADEHGTAAERPSRLAATSVPERPRLNLDLASGEIATIVWATGYRPDYSWLDVPVLDRKGRLVHDGGVVASPGLYAMGLPFMRRRKSTLIDGAGEDACDIVDHLARHLAAGGRGHLISSNGRSAA